jgi:cell division protein ZapA
MLMAQVTLRINGYAYTIGCKDGEEKHLELMGAEVNRRIDGIRAVAGPSGEARMLVMAALLMADDIAELRAKLEAVTKETRSDNKLSGQLDRIARRAEEIADNLENPQSGGAGTKKM